MHRQNIHIAIVNPFALTQNGQPFINGIFKYITIRFIVFRFGFN